MHRGIMILRQMAGLLIVGAAVMPFLTQQTPGMLFLGIYALLLVILFLPIRRPKVGATLLSFVMIAAGVLAWEPLTNLPEVVFVVAVAFGAAYVVSLVYLAASPRKRF